MSERPSFLLVSAIERLEDPSFLSLIQCSICLEIFREPQQCSNGHLFCKNCILKSLKTKKECPQCRCSLSKSTLCRNLFLRDFIDKVKVFCRYKYFQVFEGDYDSHSKAYNEDPNGCQEAIEFKDVANHEKNCSYGFVWCPNTGTGNNKHYVRLCKLPEHQSSCQWKLSTCVHCNTQIYKIKEKEHEESCQMILIKCDSCLKLVERGKFQLHLFSDCPSFNNISKIINPSFPIINNQMPFQGANFLFNDPNNNAYVNNFNVNPNYYANQLSLSSPSPPFSQMNDPNHVHQLASLNHLFNAQLINMEKKFQSSIRELERKYQAIISNRSVSQRVTWKVSNLLSEKNANHKSVLGPKFKFMDATWYLAFYFEGDSDPLKDFASIFLFLDDHSGLKGGYVFFDLTIKVLNKNFLNNVIREFPKLTFPSAQNCVGDRKLVRFSDLAGEKNGFLYSPGETIYVEVEFSGNTKHLYL